MVTDMLEIERERKSYFIAIYISSNLGPDRCLFCTGGMDSYGVQSLSVFADTLASADTILCGIEDP